MQKKNNGLQLFKIGSKVKINLGNLNDLLPTGLRNQIKNNPIATVIDYKMTDGTDIGVVVEFENNTVSWFFSKELNQISEDGTVIYNSKNLTDSEVDTESNLDIKELIIDILKIKTYNTNYKIKYLANPKSFLNWLLYSVKDTI